MCDMLFALWICLLVQAAASQPHRRPVQKIALEEHVMFREIWQWSNQQPPPPYWYQYQYGLTDLQDGRLHERITQMDAANLALTILSVSGETQNLRDTSTAAAHIRWLNQQMAEGVALYPTRFRFFCALPMFDVSAAITELNWCMSRPLCSGFLINGYATDGPTGATTPTYYDSEAYHPFWTRVQELSAKVYFHPRAAEPRPLFAAYPILQADPWGFSIETGEHMLRFILGGFFERFPRITFIIGHNGEMITYWADRLDYRLQAAGLKPNTVLKALRNNFYITTSGMFSDSGLKHVIDVMGVDRVMYSVDMPYADAVNASTWFDKATAGMLRSDVEKIAYRNAAKLFGLSL